MTGTDAPVPRYPWAQYPSAQYPSAQRLELVEKRAPRLIRREDEVGHAARAVSRTVALATDHLCFLAQYTGLDLEAVHTR